MWRCQSWQAAGPDCAPPDLPGSSSFSLPHTLLWRCCWPRCSMTAPLAPSVGALWKEGAASACGGHPPKAGGSRSASDSADMCAAGSDSCSGSGGTAIIPRDTACHRSCAGAAAACCGRAAADHSCDCVPTAAIPALAAAVAAAGVWKEAVVGAALRILGSRGSRSMCRSWMPANGPAAACAACCASGAAAAAAV